MGAGHTDHTGVFLMIVVLENGLGSEIRIVGKSIAKRIADGTPEFVVVHKYSVPDIDVCDVPGRMWTNYT